MHVECLDQETGKRRENEVDDLATHRFELTYEAARVKWSAAIDREDTEWLTQLLADSEALNEVAPLFGAHPNLSPLGRAIEGNGRHPAVRMVDVLLRLGADPNAVCREDDTCDEVCRVGDANSHTHSACWCGTLTVKKELPAQLRL
jgi:hypothetical protein